MFWELLCVLKFWWMAKKKKPEQFMCVERSASLCSFYMCRFFLSAGSLTAKCISAENLRDAEQKKNCERDLGDLRSLSCRLVFLFIQLVGRHKFKVTIESLHKRCRMRKLWFEKFLHTVVWQINMKIFPLDWNLRRHSYRLRATLTISTRHTRVRHHAGAEISSSSTTD